MKIEVECIKEHEDGSADVIIHTDSEGTKFLVEYAILGILVNAAQERGYKNDPRE